MVTAVLQDQTPAAPFPFSLGKVNITAPADVFEALPPIMWRLTAQCSTYLHTCYLLGCTCDNRTNRESTGEPRSPAMVSVHAYQEKSNQSMKKENNKSVWG